MKGHKRQSRSRYIKNSICDPDNNSETEGKKHSMISSRNPKTSKHYEFSSMKGHKRQSRSRYIKNSICDPDNNSETEGKKHGVSVTCTA